LTVALALQHFGHKVSVFEQSRELREIGAGVTITPNAMHALHCLGIGKRVANEAGPTEAYLIRHFQTGDVIKVRASGHDYVERFGADYHQVHRAILHTALAEVMHRNDPDCVFLEHCFATHHDALEFPDGRIVLLTTLCEGQQATVLQLPAEPKTSVEVQSQRRAAYIV